MKSTVIVGELHKHVSNLLKKQTKKISKDTEYMNMIYKHNLIDIYRKLLLMLYNIHFF